MKSLSKLIAACGDDFFQLTRGESRWYAEADTARQDSTRTGKTPEEAVKNLLKMLKKRPLSNK